MVDNHLIFIQIIGKRLCVCQVSTEGTGSRGQTEHSDTGQMCADFTFTSANGSSTHPNLDRCRHMREQSKYACGYCGSECNDRNQWLHHVKTMHDGTQFACHQCQRSYVSISGLNEHVNKMHKKLTRYRCETCERGFMDRSYYYDHVAAHTGVNRHTCSICDIKFVNKSTLKKQVLHFHPNDTAHML